MKSPDRRSVLKTIGTGAVTFATGVGTAAAHDDDDDEARVRVAHASPDAPAVDVYVDDAPDESEPTIAGLEFTDVTEYLPIPEGTYEVTITAAGTTDPVPPTPLSVEVADGAYTIAAIGELSPEGHEPEFTVDVYEDDLSRLDEETGRVRMYHAVPDAPAVEVRVVDDPTLARGLEFAEQSRNKEIPADTYPVAVYPADCDEPVLGPVDVDVREGQMLTVFAVGNLEPEDGEPDLQPVTAYADTAPFGGGMADDEREDESEGDAKVRVAHASPDAPDVDVYVDKSPDGNEPTLAGLEFTDVTGYLELPADEYEITITAAGSNEAVPPTPLTAEFSDADYTVAAIGELSPEGHEPDFTVDVFEDELGRLDDGMGRVRAYHAVPDAPAVDVRVVDGPTVASGLEFGMEGQNVEVPAETYPVAVYPADDHEPVFGPVDVEVRDGDVLTVFATGNLEPEGDEPGFQPVLAYEEAAPFGQGNGSSDDEGNGQNESGGNEEH